jgi:hypothetical protein
MRLAHSQAMPRLAPTAGFLALVLAIAPIGCSDGGSDGGDEGGSTDDGSEDNGSDDGTEDGGGEDGEVEPDPCAGQMPECPAESGLEEGSGLAPIDRCAFPLEDRGSWDDSDAIIDGLAGALEVVSVSDVLGDLNRTAEPIDPGQLPGDVPGVTSAFAWQSGDESVPYWIPQGITGSGDGVDGGRVDGRRVLLVSWYYDREEDPGSSVQKGVRIALVDATDPAAIAYRFLLLVEPTMTDGRPDFGPVEIHAGGLAWVGDYLYVVDTTRGLRVFDLTRILAVDTGADSIGYDPDTDAYHAHDYAYAVPQLGAYDQASACEPRFSFVSVDHSSSPPSLVTGEYDADSIYGRLFRWPLAADGRLRQVGDPARVIADGAWFSSHSHIQGGLSQSDTFWLSSSKPEGAGGILYRSAEQEPSADLGWSDTPEDLSYDPVDGMLWSLSEGLGARHVFSLPLGDVD